MAEAGRMHSLPGSQLTPMVRLPQAQKRQGHEGQMKSEHVRDQRF